MLFEVFPGLLSLVFDDRNFTPFSVVYLLVVYEIGLIQEEREYKSCNKNLLIH